MGKIRQGIIGGLIGNVGNVSGQRLCGHAIVKGRKSQLSTNNRVAGQVQNARFKLVSECVKEYGWLINESLGLLGLAQGDLSNRMLRGLSVVELVKFSNGFTGGCLSVNSDSDHYFNKSVYSSLYNRFNIIWDYKNISENTDFNCYLNGLHYQPLINKKRFYHVLTPRTINRLSNTYTLKPNTGPSILIGYRDLDGFGKMGKIYFCVGTF